MSYVIKLENDAQPPDGYVLAVRNEGPQAGRYAVAPRSTCPSCYGRGVVTITRARVRPAGGLGKLEATTERVQQLCGCVGGRLHRALDAGGSGTLSGPPVAEPLVTPSDPGARQAGRLARLRAEIAAAAGKLTAAEAARDAAVAPHLARKADAEARADELRTAERAALTAANVAEAVLLTATEELADATARHAGAQARAEAADAALGAARDALAPVTMEIEAAQRAATAAANRGHRHRVEVAQKRLAELRARLARVEDEAPGPPAEAAP